MTSKKLCDIILVYIAIHIHQTLDWAKEGNLMNITEVRVRLVKKDDAKIKGVASFTIDDCFVVHDVKILQGTREEGTYFINMPCRKTPHGEYKDIVHPLNRETREMIFNLIMKEFEAEQAKAEVLDEVAATS